MEEIDVKLNVHRAEMYLKDAPKGPYASLVKGLVESIHHARGVQEDTRADLGLVCVQKR